MRFWKDPRKVSSALKEVQELLKKFWTGKTWGYKKVSQEAEKLYKSPNEKFTDPRKASHEPKGP